MATLEATADAPLALAMLDMNGLKQINDSGGGHSAGDQAIRDYLTAIVTAVGTAGEVYRGDGGDEVVIILPRIPTDDAQKIIWRGLSLLAKESALVGQDRVSLSASCGLAVAREMVNADDLLSRVDALLYATKKWPERKPNQSGMMVEGASQPVLATSSA